jgi:hypothetical protein
MVDNKLYLFSEEHQVMPCHIDDIEFSEMSMIPSYIPPKRMRKKVKNKIYNYLKSINIEEEEEYLQGV